MVNYPRSLFRRKYLTARNHESRLMRFFVAPLLWFWNSVPSYLPFYILVAVAGYALYHGLQRATVISAFHLPPENKEKPLPFSGETVADVLKNAITAIRDEAEGRTVPAPCDVMAVDDTTFGGLRVRASTAFQAGGPVTVAVTGFSASAVVSEARQVLGRERIISGDVELRDSTSFQLAASANDAGPWTVTSQEISLKGLENASCELAERILTDTDKDLLASALIRRKKFARVVGLYSPIAPYERDPDALNNLGVALFSAGTTKTDQDAAIARFRQAIVLTRMFHFFGVGHFPEAHYNLGNVLAAQGHPEEAAAEYRKAIALNPSYFEAHYNLGNTLGNQGHSESAIEEYQRAIALNPNDAEAHDNLGNALAARGHSDEEAMEEYRKATALNPKLAHPHNNAGILLTSQGHYEEAMAEYRIAIALDSDYASPHNNLGFTLATQGHPEEAMAEYHIALHLNPNYAEAHDHLGTVLADQGHPEEGIAECQKAIAIDPDYAEAYNHLGVILETQGRLNEAIADYRKALTINSNLHEARANLEKALRKKPPNAMSKN